MNNKINYAKELDKILTGLIADRENGIRPTLLLHSCCAPCSSYVLEYLREYFDITVFYYNPNIDSDAEYRRRQEEQKQLIRALNHQVELWDSARGASGTEAGIITGREPGAESGVESERITGREPGITTGVRSECHAGLIRIIEGDYEAGRFYQAVKGYESYPEGGERCTRCFHLRLEETAKRAAALGFDYFTTTLTISPLKDAQRLNIIGSQFGTKYGVAFLPSDFKKKNGYKRSVELSRQFQLYRQDYCGCIYSKREREERG